MKFKTNTYFTRFLQGIIESILYLLIASVLAVLMIGMIFGASIQESDKLSAMAAVEVEK